MEFLRTMPGLEDVRMLRPGYAIEYDFAPPTQLKPTLETKLVQGLFFAGQINGSSGYEEAAGQGLMAGINATLLNQGREPVVLQRSQAYIGVMIDDLVTKGTSDPYRLLTSRAEYRLLLRQDNADHRLTSIGRDVGLVKDDRWESFRRKSVLLENEMNRLRETSVGPDEPDKLALLGIDDLSRRTSLEELLRRPELSYQDIARLNGRISDLAVEIEEQVEIQVKYDGYIRREQVLVERHRRLEGMRISEGFDYSSVAAMSREGREKLSRVRPISIGQAARIPGLTPADISILMVVLERDRRSNV